MRNARHTKWLKGRVGEGDESWYGKNGRGTEVEYSLEKKLDDEECASCEVAERVNMRM